MKQYIFRSILIFALLGRFSSTIEAQNSTSKAITYNFGKQYQLESKILGETRRLLIYVPEKYKKSTEKFPVIYVLDGQIHYKHATTTADILQKKGQIPASIIVAITNNEGTVMRDFSTKTANYARFLKEEVLPFVANNFRVNGHKTLFGHSRPGAFVLETLVKTPNAFDNYIAANPIVNEAFVTKFEHFLDHNKNLDQSLYFSMGGVHDVGPRSVRLMKALSELLTKKAPKSFQWKYQYFPQHVHHTTPSVTFYEGLANNFKDFQDPIIGSYQKFVAGNGMDGVKAYFKKRSLKYYTTEKITTNTIAGLGFAFMERGHAKEAAVLVKDIIKNMYPESIHLHRVLGRAYEKMNANKEALKTYKKMLALAKQQNKPGLDYYEAQITRLKKKQ
jgi:predicted alpha/beta superfamily hydrolase